jgi:hypothetical protein
MVVKKRPARFLNESPEAVERRRVRTAVRKVQRAPGTQKHSGNRHAGRPCCGKLPKNCDCKAPAGLQQAKLRRLLAHFKQSPILGPEDTTDVSVFQKATFEACGSHEVDLPAVVLFRLSFLHALFPQEALWTAFVTQGVISYQKPWFLNVQTMAAVLRSFRQREAKTRSSNYYSVTLKKYSPDRGRTWVDPPRHPAGRDSLMASLVWDSVPQSCWDRYQAAPSRDLWTAANVVLRENLRQSTKGIDNGYMHKCALDRFFSVHTVDPGTVAWWPTECPAYMQTYAEFWTAPPTTEKTRFQALMHLYKHMRKARSVTIPTALAHTCWLAKEDAGRAAF